MRDAKHLITALDQRASGSITYGVPVGAEYASATVTVVDFAKAILTAAAASITYGTPVAGVKATGSFTVVDWSVFASVKATASITYGNPVEAEYASGTITYGVPVNGDTVTVNGVVFTKATSGSGNQFSSIAELTAAITALANISATDNGTVITIVADARGTAGNAYTLVLGGANSGTMSVSGATFTGGLEGDTVIVNGSTFTAVASAPGANEFSNITELEVLCEAVTGIDSTENGTVVSLSAATAGTAGNAYTLALGGANAGTMTVSGATFTGGKEVETITVNGNVLTANVDFTAETSNDATATNLATAIAALDNVTASAVAAVVTVTADNEGTTANAYNLLTSNVAAATASGGTMTGGVNGDTVIVNGSTFTCVASSPGANEFSSITELEVLCEAVADVNASENGTVVSLVSATAGAAGNSKTLALGGSNAGSMSISGATFTGGYDNLTINVNGNALVQGTNFTAETSNAVTATNIAAAIDGLAGFTATADGVIITLKDATRGTAGNADTLTTSSTAAATVSAATLSGGVDGDTVTVRTTTMTCVVGTSGGGEFNSITELEVLIEAISGVDSSAASGVITIVANTPGAAGNAYQLAVGVSNAGTMAVSGATLTGGSDHTYTDAFQVVGHDGVQVFLQVDTLTGSSPTLDVNPEVSADKVNWVAAKDSAGSAITFAQATAATSEQKWVQLAGQWIRCKLNLGGTNPVATGHVQFVTP